MRNPSCARGSAAAGQEAAAPGGGTPSLGDPLRGQVVAFSAFVVVHSRGSGSPLPEGLHKLGLQLRTAPGTRGSRLLMTRGGGHGEPGLPERRQPGPGADDVGPPGVPPKVQLAKGAGTLGTLLFGTDHGDHWPHALGRGAGGRARAHPRRQPAGTGRARARSAPPRAAAPVVRPAVPEGGVRAARGVSTFAAAVGAAQGLPCARSLSPGGPSRGHSGFAVP